jgi:hypothetical protein
MKKLAAIVLVSFSICGCSTMMSSPEPRELWPKLKSTSCSTSKAPAALDGIGGGILLGAGIIGLASGNPASWLDVLVGGILAWSSSEGSTKAENCGALRNYLVDRPEEKTSDDERNDDRLYIEKQKLELERLKLEMEREKLKMQMKN